MSKDNRSERVTNDHLPGCGYHPDAKPESWDPVVGAGCLCPVPNEPPAAREADCTACGKADHEHPDDFGG